MENNAFAPLALADWRATRDTLHRYAKVLGTIRGALTPKQQHWRHISLRVTPEGLSTTPIPYGKSCFELRLDPGTHYLTILTDRKPACRVDLAGQPAAAFGVQILTELADRDIRLELDEDVLCDVTPGDYDRRAAENYWRALQRIDAAFKQFQAGLGKHASPVQLWPHHFDLALTWFSGRRVPDADPADAEAAEEQMTFGFSTGDESIPDAYFYVTAHPSPPGLYKIPLPPHALWHTRDWTGAVMPYAALQNQKAPEEKLLGFLKHVHTDGSRLMRTG